MKILNKIAHKIHMRMMLLIRRGLEPGELVDDADVDYIVKMAPKMASLIIGTYMEKCGTGSLWLDRMLHDDELMMNLEAEARKL